MTGFKPTFRRLPLVLLTLASTAGVATAERIVVRSGEHEGYSRLVLDLPRPVRWDLQIADKTARLALSNISAEFDLDDAYRRLSADRIVGLDPVAGKNALNIALGCDCKVKAFRVGAGMLVVDILGPAGTPDAPPETTSFETASTSPSTTAPDRTKTQPRYYFPFESTTSPMQQGLSFGAFVAASKSKPSAEASDREPTASHPAPAQSPTTDQLKRTQRVTEAEKRLAKQLSRAATQGLVTPRMAQLPKPSPETDSTAKADAPAPRAQPDTPILPSNQSPGVNLRAQTSADRDLVKLLGALPQTGTGARCFSDAELDVTTWANEAPFGEQVGNLRASLVGEFDRPNPKAARNLIKLYIHYGFGAEALHVLKTSELSGNGVMLLKSMAEIVEFGHSRLPGPLGNQLDCDSAAALWAILSREHLPPAAQINNSAVLRGISALPPHIRVYLGPILSNRLVAAGFDDLAGRVLRLVERGHETPDASFNMADAGLHLAEGDVAAASKFLGTVVDANTEQSPKALVALIDARLDAGLSLDIQTADLAGAYAREYRKEPLGDELKRVHILALAEAGAYDAAFHELALFSEQTTAENARETRSHAMAALSHDAGDVPFLKHALDTHDADHLAPASANAVAERLISLGFPVQADDYLHLGAEGSDGQVRHLLRARAALAQSKPRRVEADLLGLSGPEADLLRAEARSLSGDHATAQRLLAGLDHNEAMMVEAWLASDWQVLGNSDDPLWQETAAMATAPGQPEATPVPGVLARNRALIDASHEARNTMSELLTRMPVDALPATEE